MSDHEDQEAPPSRVLVPVGVRILRADPVRSVWLPLELGVHAFYGLNGAGKTRLLNAVANLYDGVGHGYVVARAMPVDPEDRPIDLTYLIHEPNFQHGEQEWMAIAGQLPWQSSDRPSLQRLVGDHLWHALRWSNSGVDLVGLVAGVDEVTRQDLFALTPSGKRGSEPTWSLSPCVLIDAESPALLSELTRLLHARRTYDWRAVEAGVSRPYEYDDAVDVEEFFAQIMAECGVAHLDSLLTTVSPLMDALRDYLLEDFEEETRLLEDASLTPYRLGASDVFHELTTLQGRLATVVRGDDLNPATARSTTLFHLRQGLGAEEVVEAVGASVAPGASVITRAQEHERVARELYESLLLDRPELKLQVKHPSHWFVSSAVTWVAEDPSGKDVELKELSEAQRRWALIAIAVATRRRTAPDAGQFGWRWAATYPLVLALDEPDSALHATAERHAVEGLVGLAREWEATVYCATHSREFLNARDVNLHHVTRDASASTVLHSMPLPARMRVTELGLGAADLFLLHRVVLVVEGLHEEIIFEELIGEELERARVLVIPMRGGRLLSTVVDSYLLAQFSDAPVVAALDNVHAREIQAFWHELASRADQGQAAFDEVVKRHFTSRRRDEETFFINYCRAALATGQADRFHVFGFSKPDIPEYLPVAALVPGANSWEELRRDFAAQQQIKSFKPWLKEKRGVEYTEQALRDAARSLDDIHPDFSALIELCRDLSVRRRS